MKQNSLQPTKRFSNVAVNYAESRPDYPLGAINYIIERCELKGQSLLVDIGSGTGISSRAFAERGVNVVGIEPNREMRQQADSAPLPSDGQPPVYRYGTGEATGLPNEVAQVVLSAQAFHWLDGEKALSEFHRILKPEGWVVLIWNERDATDPFTSEYVRTAGAIPDHLRFEVPQDHVGGLLLRSKLFSEGQRCEFRHSQTLTSANALVKRASAVSFATRRPQEQETIAQQLQDLFRHYAANGVVSLKYNTQLFIARRHSS